MPGRGRGMGGLHPVTRTLERIEAAVSFHRFCRGRRPGNRKRFLQFHRAEHPGKSSGAGHARYFLHRRRSMCCAPIPRRCRCVTCENAISRHCKIIAPGRVYRVDSDATHSPMFHQVEGLWIDEEVSFADLKGVMADFLQRFLSATILQVRFRPSFFPFTEPSAEMDIALMCNGAVPREGAGWLESAAAAWCIPMCCKHVGIDSEKYHRLRLWPGRGSSGHAALRRKRSAPVLRERFALSEAIQLKWLFK